MPAFLSNVKLPKPLEALLADLRERGLLPVVVVLVVAIVAVPVLLSSSSPTPQPPRAAAAGTAASFQASQAQPVVLAAGQSVRNFKKRLNTAAAKNPFVQQYAPAASNSSSTLVATGVAASGGAASSSPVSTGKTGTKTRGKPATKYVAFTIKAYVGVAATKLTLRPNVQRLDLLPSNAMPAAVFLGVSPNAKMGLFMVSSQVSQVSGDGTCIMGQTTCSLLYLAPGKTALFQFADGKIYAVKLIRINRVLHNKPVG